MSSRIYAVFARPLRRIRGQLKRSVARRGIPLTILYVPLYPLVTLLRGARDLTPRRRLLEAQSRREGDEFDRAFGVDTAGLIFLDGMEVVGPNRDHGHAYLGVRPRDFRQLLGAIPVAHERYVFVDYGSGKGRALLLAAEWPFKAIVGLEFTPALHRIGETNIQTYQNPACRCGELRTLCMDAAEFEPPREPAILYFNNPFSAGVLSAVLERVQRSLEECPRDLWIGYQTPIDHRVLDRAPFLERVASTASYRIYRSRSR
jgi:hypothetical protein